MAKVIFGNHSAVRVRRTERDKIRKFYRDVLDCKAEGALSDDDFLKATFLELKTDNVEGMRQKIVGFGVKVLEVPDPHLYFQAPGGQVWRLVGINEDLSKYEGNN